ncbi:MAG: hypothetical protein PHO00_02065 [bacterium]|nr:hypothetical protein [bacterium]
MKKETVFFIILCFFAALSASAEECLYAGKSDNPPTHTIEKVFSVSNRIPVWISDSEIVFVRESIMWIVNPGDRVIDDEKGRIIKEEVCILNLDTGRIIVIYNTSGREKRITGLGLKDKDILIKDDFSGNLCVTENGWLRKYGKAEESGFADALARSKDDSEKKNRHIYEEGGSIMMKTGGAEKPAVLVKSLFKTVELSKKR